MNAQSHNDKNEDLAQLIRNRSSKEFAEAKGWFSRINKEKAEQLLVDRIVENLSENLSSGVIQLTVQKLSKTQECKNAIKNGKLEVTLQLQEKLPPFTQYVEFVPRIGSIEIASVRYEFVVQTEIEAHDVRITIANGHIDRVSIDSLAASIELSILVNTIKIKLGEIQRQMRIRWNSRQTKLPLRSRIIETDEPTDRSSL